jgi:hypothetical protein
MPTTSRSGESARKRATSPAKAEGEGFEPSVRGLPAQRFSRPSHGRLGTVSGRNGPSRAPYTLCDRPRGLSWAESWAVRFRRETLGPERSRAQTANKCLHRSNFLSHGCSLRTRRTSMALLSGRQDQIGGKASAGKADYDSCARSAPETTRSGLISSSHAASRRARAPASVGCP